MSFLKRLLGEKKAKLKPPKQMYADSPPGVRAYLLNDLALQMSQQQKGKPLPYGREADRLHNTMFRRNERAIKHEKAGRIDQAIALYEQNVTDRFDGNHPYTRLRILYTKRKQYDQAIRVCQAFVDTADLLIGIGSPRGDLKPKRDKFQEWITKLERK